MDYDILMLEALDDTIQPADRARLEAHFDQHPEQRAAFLRMQSLDLALRKTPPVPPPADFAQRVMAAARTTPIARPITRRQIAAFVAANSVLMALAWLMTGAVVLLLAVLVAQQPAAQALLVFVRGAVFYVADILGLFSSVAWAVVRHPLFWIGTLAAAALVAAWLTLIVTLLRPSWRYVA